MYSLSLVCSWKWNKMKMKQICTKIKWYLVHFRGNITFKIQYRTSTVNNTSCAHKNTSFFPSKVWIITAVNNFEAREAVHGSCCCYDHELSAGNYHYLAPDQELSSHSFPGTPFPGYSSSSRHSYANQLFMTVAQSQGDLFADVRTWSSCVIYAAKEYSLFTYVWDNRSMAVRHCMFKYCAKCFVIILLDRAWQVDTK